MLAEYLYKHFLTSKQSKNAFWILKSLKVNSTELHRILQIKISKATGEQKELKLYQLKKNEEAEKEDKWVKNRCG